MAKAITLYDTTIGKKVVMAVSGLALYGFVIAHMLGNLQVFLGPNQLNAYASKLQSLGPLLWLARGVVFVCAATHVVTVVQLYLQRKSARPIAYRMKQNTATTYAALTMKYGGMALLLFIIYHLAHFTVPGIAMSAAYQHDAHDVYANVVHGFGIPWVATIYIVAQLFLGLHLYHGSWSLFQTLGFNHPKYDETRKFVAQTIGVFVAAGNIAIPVAVLAGVVR